MRRFGLLALSVCALAACQEQPVEQVEALPQTQRTLAQGTVVGFGTEQGAHSWRAIPYAAAPEGDLRWRAPRPPSAFDGTFEALEFGPRCPQVTNALDEGEGLEAGLLIGDENCLTLDVYAPPDAAERGDLPVMVWIHGGGNTWGRSSAYNGSQLALDRDVIIVAIQYRLGPLGWFAHPALRDAAQTEADTAASFALQDMIAALEWVQANGAAFGGDTDRVTIFGESAGGHNVAALLASPPARGLFHRAIIESGIVWSTPLPVAEEGDAYTPHGAIEIVDGILGAEADAEAIRSMGLGDLFEAYGIDGDPPRMIEDGVVLPEGGIRAAASTPGGMAEVPVITGSNRDEMKLYRALDPQFVNRLSLLIWPKDADVYEASVEYPSRYWRALAVDGLANRLIAAGHEEVWAYRFDWDEGGSLLVTDTGRLFGAAHSMEIPFVFNHFDFYGRLDALLFTNGNAAGRDALANAMGEAWGRFAHTGAPTSNWTRWQSGGALMRFDTPEGGGPEMITGEETLEGILDDLAEDPRLDAQTRCWIADALIEWEPSRADIVTTRIPC